MQCRRCKVIREREEMIDKWKKDYYLLYGVKMFRKVPIMKCPDCGFDLMRWIG